MFFNLTYNASCYGEDRVEGDMVRNEKTKKELTPEL